MSNPWFPGSSPRTQQCNCSPWILQRLLLFNELEAYSTCQILFVTFKLGQKKFLEKFGTRKHCEKSTKHRSDPSELLTCTVLNTQGKHNHKNSQLTNTTSYHRYFHYGSIFGYAAWRNDTLVVSMSPNKNFPCTAVIHCIFRSSLYIMLLLNWDIANRKMRTNVV